jgi:hypothetical protein
MTPYCATTPNGSSEDGWHGKPRFWRSLTLPGGWRRRAGRRGKPRFGRSLTLPSEIVLDLDRCRSSGGVNRVQFARQDDAKAPVRTESHPTFRNRSRSRSFIVADQGGHVVTAGKCQSPGFGRSLTLPFPLIRKFIQGLLHEATDPEEIEKHSNAVVDNAHAGSRRIGPVNRHLDRQKTHCLGQE